jgi:hypothetical protein
MCFSTFNLIIALPLILYLAYHYFLHLLSTNHKCTQPCYFPLLYKPAAQKLKKILDSLMRSSSRAITPGRLPMEWCLSAAMLSRVLDLFFCKTLFMKQIYYIETLVILYPFSVRYVWKLDSWAHIL